MKNKLLTLMLIVSSSLFLANCSKSNNSSTDTPVATVAVAGTCTTAGYVYTTQGCLPQSASCGTNYGYLNGSCYPVTTTSTVITCSSTDVVNTQMGTLTVGVCQPYCAQYGKKYGYSNGYCYPAY